VFCQEDPAGNLFYLQQRRVNTIGLSADGKEAVVGIVGAGQFFAESCLMGQAQHTSATLALEGCVVTALAKHAMLAPLHEHPELSQMFIAFLGPGTRELKRVSSTKCSTPAKSSWRGCFC
jgi:CRP/FNR family transcriptional regulator, cyclic AMP receptor protein